jgi:hypothetical protein
MKIADATYQTILIRLTLQSCQLCDTAHDFRYDPRIWITNISHNVGSLIVTNMHTQTLQQTDIYNILSLKGTSVTM